jgi:hypothetical protein
MVHVKKQNFTFSSKEKGIEQYLVILSLDFKTKIVLSGIKMVFFHSDVKTQLISCV